MRVNRKSPVRDLLPKEAAAADETPEVKEAVLKRRDDGFLEDDALHDLWKEHKATPQSDKRARNTILRELEGFRNKAVAPYKNIQVPDTVKHQAATKVMINAIDNWDPNKGATLRSYVYMNLFPTKNPKHSVIGKVIRQHSADGMSITDDRARIITKARELIKEFEFENGRKPSDTEIGDMLAISPDEVFKLKQNLQNTYLMEHQIDDTFAAPSLITPRQRDAMWTVYHSLNARDQEVMRMLFYPHLGGAQPPGGKNKDIAKHFGISQAMVTDIKKKILKKIEETV